MQKQINILNKKAKFEYNLIQNMTNEEREYKIYLPLYDGIKNIET